MILIGWPSLRTVHETAFYMEKPVRKYQRLYTDIVFRLAGVKKMFSSCIYADTDMHCMLFFLKMIFF